MFAAGNEGEGATRSPGNYAQALSVGAVDAGAQVPWFSGSERTSWGIVPDIVAPGVDVWSTAPGDGFAIMQGTSMATPHISGLAALLLEARPAATIDMVEQAIMQSAILGTMSEARAGRGMPNASAAFRILTAMP